MLNRIIYVLVIALIAIQFFGIEKDNPPYEEKKSFFNMVKADDEVKTLIQGTCFDCHSNEVTYPWYSNIEPIGWWLKSHIDEGREHLNFSEWGKYSKKERDHKLEECYEEVEEGEMPLKPYQLAHADARFSDEQKAKLIAFFKSAR